MASLPGVVQDMSARLEPYYDALLHNKMQYMLYKAYKDQTRSSKKLLELAGLIHSRQ